MLCASPSPRRKARAAGQGKSAISAPAIRKQKAGGVPSRVDFFAALAPTRPCAPRTYFWPASVSPPREAVGRRERGEGHSTADHGDELAGRGRGRLDAAGHGQNASCAVLDVRGAGATKNFPISRVDDEQG